MALVEVKVPDIGDFKEVAVIELLVKPGDTVDGRAVADHGGVRQGVDGDSVVACRRGEGAEGQVGDKVSEGSVVLMLEAAGAAAAPAAAAGARASAGCVAAPTAAAPAPAPAAGAGPVDVVVPDIGDFKDVAVIEVFVKPATRSRSSRA